MRIIGFKNTDIVDVSALEQVAGFSFPVEYNKFLSTYNGGLIDLSTPVELNLIGTEYTVSLSVLFGINTPIVDFDIAYINAIYEEEAPEDSIIIGGTHDGGLVFVLKSDQNLAVCYWDRNLHFGFSTEEANAYILSKSFSDFMKSLGEIEFTQEKINIVEGDNSMIEKINYLPMGSIVILNGASHKLMITSRAILVQNGDEQVFFDYAGVPHPEGLVGDQVFYFNNDGIGKVEFEGYRNEEDDTFDANVHTFIDNNPEIKKGNAKGFYNI